ncbi:MBL fold metallo-hydrolase [Clostridium sp. 'White wine YQ']|uniref:MBL fold metallo-hydrolase n=1 Tax=Clostridium sp. 'White wine YQ' TaxID=3027474 RepID=UPI0023654F85|nr:MBL fold metallo-hydrolase [Clostridium sp. 'White wine YQ']MDD7796392.1 MBL fold metallo-hydrolase [Clostridium sp. 'White wine YQ']
MVEIIWFGHSCFLIKTSTGRKILMDPFDETLGYPTVEEEVDIITISHNHFDHNYINKLNSSCNICREPIKYSFNFCSIEGFVSYHDNLNGMKRGPNIIFVVEIDGLRICHLGDLGHIPTKESRRLLEPIDILMIPIGGNYTINGKDASLLTKLLNPKFVIPMHYSTPYVSASINGAEDFLISMRNIHSLEGNKLNTSSLDFNVSEPKVIFFSISDL